MWCVLVVWQCVCVHVGISAYGQVALCVGACDGVCVYMYMWHLGEQANGGVCVSCGMCGICVYLLRVCIQACGVYVCMQCVCAQHVCGVCACVVYGCVYVNVWCICAHM